MALKEDLVYKTVADPSADTDYSVILRLPKFSNECKHEDFLQALAKVIDVKEIKSLGKLKHSNEWQVTFKTFESRNKLFEVGNIKVRTKKCVIFPCGDRHVIGRVHWLPADVSDDTIKGILQNFGDVVHLDKEKISSDPDAPKSLTRFFALNLSRNSKLADIPHYIFVNSHEGLVVVKGREPMCLECSEVGHRKFQCPLRKKLQNAPRNRKKSTASNTSVSAETNTATGDGAKKSEQSTGTKTKKTKANQATPSNAAGSSKTTEGTPASNESVHKVVDEVKCLQDLMTVFSQKMNEVLTDVGTSLNASNKVNVPGPSSNVSSEATCASAGNKKGKKKKKKKANTSENYDLVAAEANNNNDTSGSGQHSPKGSLDSGIALSGNSTSTNVSVSTEDLPKCVPREQSEASSEVNAALTANSNVNQKKKKRNKKKTGTSQIPGLTHP